MTPSQPDQPEYILWLLFHQHEVLVHSETLAFPYFSHETILNLTHSEDYSLGFVDGLSVRVGRLLEDVPIPDGYQLRSLRSLLMHMSAEQFALAGAAAQVLEWVRTHRFCGCCGTPTIPHPKGERAMVCPACENTQYPRINPCVIVAIHKDDTILLARAQRYSVPMYSLLAGFVEAGETLEQAVVREVAEESGIQIKNLRYVSSQPWPFPNNLMLGFTAEWAAGELVIQEEELLDAQFFRYDALTMIPPAGSISYQLIHATVTELAHKYR